MKNLLATLLILITCSAKSQHAFTLLGTGKALKDGDRIFLAYRDGTKLVLDSTQVKNGAYRFDGITQNIATGYVARNDNPKYAEILYDSYTIYLEKGVIRLVSPDTLINSVGAGTPLNVDQTELAALLRPLEDERRRLPDPDKFSHEQLKDTALVAAAREKILQNHLAGFAPRFAFIRKHPDSFVSLVTLASLSRNSRFLPETEAVYALLNDKLKALPAGRDIARRIGLGRMVTVGAQSKDFTMADVAGKPVTLSSFRGRYVLLDFWASWCLPCREENPNLIRAYRKYATKNFTIIGVSIDEEKYRTAWLKAVKDDGLPYLNLSDLKKDNLAAKLYGISTIPANVLIDPNGKVLAKDLKGAALQQKLEDIFR